MCRGMEVISLWQCSGVMEAQVALIAAFRSSALLGMVSLIFLLTIPHRFSMGFSSGEFAGQSSTVTPGKHSGPTPADDMAAQIINDCGNFILDFKQHGFCASPLLPPDSGTLISKWNVTFTFIWKEDFGPLSNSPIIFLLSPGKMLLMMFLFQK